MLEYSKDRVRPAKRTGQDKKNSNVLPWIAQIPNRNMVWYTLTYGLRKVAPNVSGRVGLLTYCTATLGLSSVADNTTLAPALR